MNKKYIVLAVAIIGAGVLYKRSMEGMKRSAEPIASEGFVTLMSNDGQSFQISPEAAEQSEMIRAALRSRRNEAQNKRVTFEGIPADFLSLLANLLNTLPGTPNLDNLIIEKFVPYDTPELVTFAYMAQYLGITNAEESIIRLLIFEELKKNRETTLNDIRKTVFRSLVEQKFSAIPVYEVHFDPLLINNFEYITSSAGFKALSKKNAGGELHLNNQKITNTYGLSLITTKHRIKKLYLYDNKLKDLPVGVLDGFTALKMIDLSRNKLKDLHAGVFHGLSNMERLYLFNNQLKNLSAGVFNEFTNLQWLDLSNNQLQDLPVGVFNGLFSLQGLELGSNQLKRLPVGIFNGLTNLEQLKIDNNQLQDLPVGIFKGLTNLQRLNSGGNQLKDLPTGIFNGLTNLTTLWLGYNQLENLPAGIFNELTNLETLDLSMNKLKDLPVGVFNKLTKLKVLVILDENDLGMTEDQIRALLDPAIRARVRIK